MVFSTVKWAVGTGVAWLFVGALGCGAGRVDDRDTGDRPDAASVPDGAGAPDAPSSPDASPRAEAPSGAGDAGRDGGTDLGKDALPAPGTDGSRNNAGDAISRPCAERWFC